MIRLLSIIFIFHLTVPSFGQIEKKLNAVLLKRDFNAFREFAGGFDKEKKELNINAGNTRELVTGYQESLFYLKKICPYNSSFSLTCETKISIISEGNLIIYFSLESKEMKDFPKSSHITCDTIYQFNDTPKLTALKATFKKNFLAPLNENELFVDTIAYGRKCGPNGELTVQQEQIKDWVKIKDTVSLYKWLQSTNTEKQLYAVQGFNSLRFMGVKTDDKVEILIAQILKKKGSVTACIPCDSRHIMISDVAREFQTTFTTSPHK